MTLVLACTGAAQAQGFQDVSLSWVRTQGAESCIGAHALARAVERRIGHRIWIATGDAELSVEGYVRPALPTGFEALVVTSNPSGEIVGRRELRTQDEDCRSLDEPLALVIGLTIDPESGFVPLPSIFEDASEEDVAELLDQPAPPIDEVPAPQGSRDRSEQGGTGGEERHLPPPPLRTTRGVLAAVRFGAGYAPRPGLGISAGYMDTRLRSGVEARAWLPRRGVEEGAENGPYRFSTTQLSLFACPLWRDSKGGKVTGQACLAVIPGLTVVRSAADTRKVSLAFDVGVQGRLLIPTRRGITPYFGAEVALVLYGFELHERRLGVLTAPWSTPVVRGGAAFGFFFEL